MSTSPVEFVHKWIASFGSFQIDVVTEEFIKFVQEGVLKIEVFAAQTSG